VEGVVNRLVENRPVGRRGHGPECPNADCGGTLTPCRLSGKDADARPVRKRVCENCGTVFVTVESIVYVSTRTGRSPVRLAKFSEVDDVHRDRNAAVKRHKFGWVRRGRRSIVRHIHGFHYITDSKAQPDGIVAPNGSIENAA
jgi:hypothetical protein